MSGESIEDYLARSLIKDSAKGGDGWRTVADIANACAPAEGKKMIWAFDKAFKLAEDGVLEKRFDTRNWVFRSALTLAEAKKENPFYLP